MSESLNNLQSPDLELNSDSSLQEINEPTEVTVPALTEAVQAADAVETTETVQVADAVGATETVQATDATETTEAALVADATETTDLVQSNEEAEIVQTAESEETVNAEESDSASTNEDEELTEDDADSDVESGVEQPQNTNAKPSASLESTPVDLDKENSEFQTNSEDLVEISTDIETDDDLITETEVDNQVPNDVIEIAEELSTNSTDLVELTTNVVNIESANIVGFTSIQPIQDIEVDSGESFNLQLSPETFTHENPDEQLTYTATQVNGEPLPSWVKFDEESLSFTGEAPQGFSGKLDVKVIAIDSASNQAETTLTIDVAGGS